MKKGIEKSFLSEGELELINRHSKKALTEDEVYVFSLTLCDNDIDRDFERFSDEALDSLATLFIGKTGIFDHSHKAENQLSRIFSARCETGPEKTSDGRPYKSLKARAYMLKNEKTRALIEEIEGGIKKEVSVGCSVHSHVCSICGTDRKTGCIHRPGKTYKTKNGNELCHTILDDAYDAYEWSFVAVPAQRRAGVTKSHNYKENSMEEKDVYKKLSRGGDVTLTDGEASALLAEISSLKTLSCVGEQYLLERRAAVIKGLCSCLPQVDEEVIKNMTENLNLPDLSALYCSFQRAFPEPQLGGREAADTDNNGFMIK